jgi:uncharacterized phiE125 gp8 family phage protein
MNITTITPPSVEPMASDDAVIRLHLRLDDAETHEDDLIDAYIAAARARAEAMLHRRLITQTVRLHLDGFGCGIYDAMPLPIGPVQSVEAVRYIDGGGVQRTMDSADYRLVTSREPHELRPKYGSTWPVPRADADVVEIDLIVGYGDASTAIPDDIRQALRLMVAASFNDRENIVHGPAPSALPDGAAQLLSAHTLWL